LIDIRVRTVVPADEMAEKEGKVLTQDDFNVLVTNDCRVRKPDGTLLCIYRKGIVPYEMRETVRPILRSFRTQGTDNRGQASGTERVPGGQTRTRSALVPSSIIGSFEAQGSKKFCRLTAWTGRETEQFKELWPYFELLGHVFASNVPDRYDAQMREVRRTHPDWVIPDTPFTTITINNTWPTGVHKDKGDLDQGFSVLATLRKGEYEGGVLTFPEYRVGVDMRDGDVLLMDAHEWHGNSRFIPDVPRKPRGMPDWDRLPYERISTVAYFRTNMIKCGDIPSEEERRKMLAEQRAGALIGE
jgi:Oxygenase domain of the 2OGFeDO superfamily